MGTSRASKDLLLKKYTEHNLAKVYPKKRVVQIRAVPDPKPAPSQRDVMEQTLNKVRQNNYKGLR